MSPFLLVLNIISAVILAAYIVHGIVKKQRIKKAKKTAEITKNR